MRSAIEDACVGSSGGVPPCSTASSRGDVTGARRGAPSLLRAEEASICILKKMATYVRNPTRNGFSRNFPLPPLTGSGHRTTLSGHSHRAASWPLSLLSSATCEPRHDHRTGASDSHTRTHSTRTHLPPGTPLGHAETARTYMVSGLVITPHSHTRPPHPPPPPPAALTRQPPLPSIQSARARKPPARASNSSLAGWCHLTRRRRRSRPQCSWPSGPSSRAPSAAWR